MGLDALDADAPDTFYQHPHRLGARHLPNPEDRLVWRKSLHKIMFNILYEVTCCFVDVNIRDVEQLWNIQL